MNYAAALKSTRMQAVIDAVDIQGAALPGIIEIWRLSGGTNDLLLATFTLEYPSFTESGGVITLSGVPLTTTGAADGQANQARINDGNGNRVVDLLTVGLGGSVFSPPNIILDTLTIVSGQVVTLSGGTITHP
jgi:hypothetical protein